MIEEPEVKWPKIEYVCNECSKYCKLWLEEKYHKFSRFEQSAEKGLESVGKCHHESKYLHYN